MSTPAETLDAEATLAPTGAEGRVADDAPGHVLAQGTPVGRYVVLRKLGAGGMGAVYLAYDPELDRRVAVKLLHGPTGAVDPLALQREAQAMAKLQHPNVVTVYDVGEHQGRVYVAMELVAGRTLRAWLGAERRAWREVIEVFAAAGRGLWAAHERGLVHRDFKPDNVMVSDEGRVLVMDFGLARSSGDGPHDEPDFDLRSYRSSVVDAATVGRMVGTPGYMAPEQVKAGSLTPAADQFAFCVSLWEAVYGERPFEGHHVAELYIGICEGRIRTPPAGARVPGWLRRALVRGLAPDPAARWPSMAALLDVLERGRSRGRWKGRLLAGTAMIAAVGATWGWQRQHALERHEALAACEAEGAVIDEVWNDQARARVREGLLATGARFAPSSLETLVPWLDAYHDAWSSGRTAACVHATIDRDWDAERMDRSAWCFEDRRLQLEATVEQIATLDKASARRAVRIASYLDPVSTCLDPSLLQRLPAPPLELRDEIRAIRATLGESDQARHGGRYADALAAATRARARAEALGWSPLLALARFVEGRCIYEEGRYGRAEEVLVQAYFEAQDAGALEVAFRAARSLMRATSELRRYREAEVWSRHSNVLSSSLDDLGGLDEAEGHYMMSQVYMGRRDYEAAAAEGARAEAMRAQTLGMEHPITAAATRMLGTIYLEQGRYREALGRLEQASAVWQEVVGHEHPYAAELSILRGKALWELGRVDEALAQLEDGLDVQRRSLRANHPDTIQSVGDLGRVLLALGRIDEAEPMLAQVMDVALQRHGSRDPAFAASLLDMAEVDRARGRPEQALQRSALALEIVEDALEPGHPELAAAMEHAADIHRALGRFDDAIALQREALTHYEASLGAEHPQLVTPLVSQGDTLRAAGQLGPAARSYARALAIGERARGPAHATLVPSLVGLAEVALVEGDPAAARSWAMRAVRLADDEGAGPRRAADARLVLARALAGLGEPAALVDALAQQAERELETCHDAARLAELARWRRTTTTRGPGAALHRPEVRTP